MDDYKLRYAYPTDDRYQASEWMTKHQALKEFEKLKMSVLWIEVIHSPIDEDKELEEVCITYHENKLVSILGKDVIVPKGDHNA
jgi:hypothetical protein